MSTRVMDLPNLLQLHLSCLRESCAALSSLSDDVLSDKATTLRLRDLASRLPGPPMGEDPCTVEKAFHLISSARSSTNLLSESGQFSQMGDSIADELRKTLDTLEDSLGKHTRRKVRGLVYGLYVIIDPQVTGGREPVHIARETLEGGAKILQLRDKIGDKGGSLDLAKAIKQLCDEKNALFIINDHADLAAVVDASGVHVGQEDLPISSARQVLSPTQIVGRSNHLLEEALESERQGADYVAVGAMYSTGSKDQPIVGGPKLLRRVKESMQAPVVAIGGITQERVEEVVKAGADAVCVISAVGLASNPRDATRQLVESIGAAGGRA